MSRQEGGSLSGPIVKDAADLGIDDCQVWWASRSLCADWHTQLLDQAERRRYRHYLRAVDRDRFTVGVALTRLVLAAQLGARPAGVPIDRTCERCGGPHGRPRLAMRAGLDFSVSHSGDMVVFAVTRSRAGDGARRAVGVDVELISAAVADEAPVGIVLSAAERKAFSMLDAREQPKAFFRYWVRKEAVLKATGDGLAVPMTDLTVTAPDQAARLAHWQGRPDLPARVSVHDLGARPGYAAAIAFAGRDAAVASYDATELITEVPTVPI